MDLDFSDSQLTIRDAVHKVCADLDDSHWLKMGNDGGAACERAVMTHGGMGC